VTVEAGSAGRGLNDTETLLLLAASRPQEALARARALLATGPPPREASIAHQAAGVVLRDYGDVSAAIAELRTALRLARGCGDSDRATDVLATLAAALVYGGRTAAGLAAFERAVAQADGVLAGRVRVRRGIVLWTLGRNREALADLRQATIVLHRAGDAVWEARALTARADVNLAFGATERARADYAAAERLFASTSQELESAYMVHNRAMVAFRSGDLPAALALFDEAARGYTRLGLTEPGLTIDRCAVLLVAGLPTDAREQADAAIAHLKASGGQPTRQALLLLVAASAALDGEDPQAALERAGEALRFFTAQHRDWWRAHAQFLVLRASFATGQASVPLLRRAAANATRLEELRSGEAARAHLLAGQLALALGRGPQADRHLAAAARRRHRGPAMTRAVGWLAEALRAEAAGDARRLLAACRRGLSVIEEHRLTLGATELRAQATGHGTELARLAQRQNLRSGRPRDLLAWSERWRATVLAVPPVRPPDDRELGADLAALREVTSRLEEARSHGAAAQVLAREQLRLEAAVRARVLRTPAAASGARPQSDRNGSPASDSAGPGGSPGDEVASDPGRPAGSPSHGADSDPGRPAGGARGDSGGGARRVDVEGLLGALGTGRLLQVIEVDGRLHVLVCGGGRVRHVVAGTGADAAREAEFIRFGLRRLARQSGRAEQKTVAAQLEAGARALEEALLGAAVNQLGDGPVVVAPPARLHAVPWALLPSLRGRVISVAPSASAWLRARAIEPPVGRRVVVVRGPGLPAAGEEVRAVAANYPGAIVLGDDQPGRSQAGDGRAGDGRPAEGRATAAGDRRPKAAGDGRAGDRRPKAAGDGRAGGGRATAAGGGRAGGGPATAGRVLAALDGAWLAHVAAHGSFRADSPLFSSLRLDDGPLTVYDFERLGRAPYRLILPSCDSGLAGAVGADELLGLVNGLLPLGTAGIVASVVPLNDTAAAAVMPELHRRLAAGATLAGALRDVTGQAAGDPLLTGAGWSLVALGAA
jgi:tetratricopeptide (TPR) repeat protein